jgi:glycosyltransferase involved in cell wall biosynthesis
MPALSLVISTYEQPQYLERVLGGVARQASLPEQVLVADDGSGEETRQVLARWVAAKTLRLEHCRQEHEGFRKARILNAAIARATGEHIVFLDGDTVPHPEFIADHRRLATAGGFVQGHRALVQQRAAAWFGAGDARGQCRRALWEGQLKGWQHAFRWPRPWVRRRGDLRGVRGCNLGVWRRDLVQVNGYNEAFVGWGREDSELVARLMNAGVRRLDARGWALCYHLWHPPASRAELPANDELLARALASGTRVCERGLSQHLRAGV